MEQPFSKKRLAAALEPLSARHRVAFVLSVCERLLPNYAAFSREARWGSPEVLRKALDVAWSYLRGAPVSEEAATLRRRCDEITPSTEDFRSPYVSPALDSAVTVSYLLELLEEDCLESVVEVGSLARDTVDMYVQVIDRIDPRDPKLEQRILENALMQRELRRQREDIELLRQLDLTRPDAIDDLERLWRSPRESNIGVHGPEG